MGLFSACFVLLFAIPCALYFSGFLAKMFTAGLRDQTVRKRMPTILRPWSEIIPDSEEKKAE